MRALWLCLSVLSAGCVTEVRDFTIAYALTQCEPAKACPSPFQRDNEDFVELADASIRACELEARARGIQRYIDLDLKDCTLHVAEANTCLQDTLDLIRTCEGSPAQNIPSCNAELFSCP